MKLLISKKLRLRNKTFVWTGNVRNVFELNVFSVGCQDLKNSWGSIGTVEKSQKPLKTDEKMKVDTQDTTKTAMTKQNTKEIMM